MKLKKFGALLLACTMTAGMTGCSAGSDASKIKKALNNVYAENPYIQLMVGDDTYVYLLYNKDKEAMAESDSGGTAFYRNDNKIITVSDTEAYMDYDLNPLQFIEKTVDVASANKDTCTITSEKMRSEETTTKNADGTTTTHEAVDYTLYTIAVNGTDTIKKIYETVDADYATTSMEMLTEGFESVDPNNIVLTLKVSVGNEGEFGASCEVAFGEDVYTSWLFDGYLSTFEWKYDEKWYAETIDAMTADEWIELAVSTIEDLSNKMVDYVEQNQLAPETSADWTYENWEEAKASNNTISLVEQMINELETIGASVNCTPEDLESAINSYYTTEESKEVGPLQAAVEIGNENGWILLPSTESTDTTTTESTTDSTTESTTESTSTTDSTTDITSTTESTAE